MRSRGRLRLLQRLDRLLVVRLARVRVRVGVRVRVRVSVRVEFGFGFAFGFGEGGSLRRLSSQVVEARAMLCTIAPRTVASLSCASSR